MWLPMCMQIDQGHIIFLPRRIDVKIHLKQTTKTTTTTKELYLILWKDNYTL